jgi:glycine cleavage system H lipoate-binding protein
MDGVEVVKAVHHLRPDVDIAVITGYGTIDTAVETMQHGAVEYVQKPFTEDELVAFTRRLVIRRQARLEAARKPVVRLTAPAAADAAAARDYAVPGGAFVAPGHVWLRIDPSGRVNVGLDDFGRKALALATAIALPPVGREVASGDALFTLTRNGAVVRCTAPLGGRVVAVNEALRDDVSRLRESPYVHGWVCALAPRDLAAELPQLRIGQPLIAWYQDEIVRLREMGCEDAQALAVEKWPEFERRFLVRDRMAAAVPAHEEAALTGGGS